MTLEEMSKSPLYQAHLLEKRADMLAKKHLYEKAVDCREKAIENLRLARSNLLTIEAYASLDQQITIHDAKIRLLKEQARKKESRLQTAQNPSTIPFDPISRNRLSSFSKDDPIISSVSSSTSDIETAIKKELLKGDKLLESLISQHSRDTLTSDTGTPDHHAGSITSAIKLPKSLDQVVEELRLHNSQLRSHVEFLFGELEKSRLDNRNLKEELEALKKKTVNERNFSATVDQKDPSGAGSRQGTIIHSASAVDLHPLEPFKAPDLPLFTRSKLKIGPRKSKISE